MIAWLALCYLLHQWPRLLSLLNTDFPLWFLIDQQYQSPLSIWLPSVDFVLDFLCNHIFVVINLSVDIILWGTFLGLNYLKTIISDYHAYRLNKSLVNHIFISALISRFLNVCEKEWDRGRERYGERETEEDTKK